MQPGSRHCREKYLPRDTGEDRTAICLSGGGFRAVLFHIGALRRLNEFGILPQVDSISSVSGGSILNGLLAKCWPHLHCDGQDVFTNFEEVIQKPIERFVSRNLRVGTIFWERFKPWNWLRLLRGDYSVTDVLAKYYDKYLYRGHLLSRSAERPKFIINTTNMKTGGLWEFRQDQMGEPLLGYIGNHDVRISQAVAASSSYPLVFPPLLLKNDPSKFEMGVLGPQGNDLRKSVALTDGGVYDNLGLASVWKDHRTIFCCDAGTSFQLDPNFRDWFVNRLLRTFGIIYAQGTEVHKRWLISSFLDQTMDGAYIGLSAYHGNYGLNESVGYPNDIVSEIARMRTDLDAFSREEIMTLINHGYTLADTAVRRYMTHRVRNDAPLQLPYPDFVDRKRILSAIEQSDHFYLFGRNAA